MAKPKIFFHSSYVGQGGYNNHAQNLVHELSKLSPLKIRNFSVSPTTWKGISDEPHNGELYLTDKDKKLNEVPINTYDTEIEAKSYRDGYMDAILNHTGNAKRSEVMGLFSIRKLDDTVVEEKVVNNKKKKEQ